MEVGQRIIPLEPKSYSNLPDLKSYSEFPCGIKILRIHKLMVGGALSENSDKFDCRTIVLSQLMIDINMIYNLDPIL